MRRTLCLVACLLATPSVAAPADEPQAVRLSLAEALGQARKASPRLGQLDALRRSWAAAVRGARAARLPQLDLSAAYTRNSSVPELTIGVPGGGARTIFPNIPDNYRARAAVSVPLYTGGRLEGALDAARQQRTAAEKELEAGEHDLHLEVATAYWSLVTARETARVLAEAVASYDAHLADARNRAEVGMAARNEVLAVQVERDRAELSRLRAASEAEIAQANLRRLLGVAPTARVETTEPVTATDAPAEPVDALVTSALRARPEIASLRSRIAAAAGAVRIARAAARPQASLSAGYDYANPNTRILPLTAAWKGTWSLGVAVSVTAFDGGRTAAAAAQAEAEADALRLQLEDLEGRVRLEVTSCALDLETARAALALAERNLEAGRENARVSQDRYQEGLIPSSELLDAEAALLRAGLDQTATAAQLRTVLASLDRAVGR
jgi:outer membrane protein TolC